MERSLTAKFGPPPLLHATPLPRDALLLVQLAACAALLVAIAPPFVMAPTLCPRRVFAVSLLTTAATVVMHRCGAKPMDVIPGACEALYRTRA